MNGELDESVRPAPRVWECLEITPLMRDQLTGELEAEAARAVVVHMATCAACRATAAAVALVLQAGTSAAEVDLWLRLRDRLALAGKEELLRLRFPPLNWRIATALATVASVPWLVAERGEFLALIVGLL